MRLAACLAGSFLLALSGEGSVSGERCPVELRYVNYPVAGSTLEEIKQSIDVNGPVEPDGTRRYARTDWKIQWIWDKTGVGVDPSTVRIVCKATVTLPEHDSPKTMSQAELARWNKYRALLKMHELNHVRHVEVVAPKISREIARQKALRGQVSAKAAQKIAKEVIREIHGLDRSYDRSTRHGATEGI